MVKGLVTAGMIVGLIGATPFLSRTGRRSPSQTEPACLHGRSETTADASRRQAALRFARQVNTLEAAGKRMGDTYYSLSDLPDLSPVPDGFQARLTTDGASYAFSVKDLSDACRFAYFSDQDGVIYTATPIR